MSGVIASQDHLDDEQAGEATLELVAIRYTGRRTIYSVEQHLTQAGWPGGAPLDGGPKPDSDGAWQFALVPDSALATLEGRPDIEVVYGDQRERFAEILLDRNRLPENVFGRGADRTLQERVIDALELDPPGEVGVTWETQLKAVAGREDEDEDTDEPDAEAQSLAGQLADEYTRHELGDLCKALRPDPSACNLNDKAGKTDRAEYVAGFDKAERAAAVESVFGDGGADE